MSITIDSEFSLKVYIVEQRNSMQALLLELSDSSVEELIQEIHACFKIAVNFVEILVRSDIIFDVIISCCIFQYCSSYLTH